MRTALAGCVPFLEWLAWEKLKPDTSRVRDSDEATCTRCDDTDDNLQPGMAVHGKELTMPHLAFFPWIELEDDIDVGGYSLKRFRRGNLPRVDEECRATLDSVLEPYRDTADKPVGSAVILHRTDRGLTDALSDRDRGDLFHFAELFAFAALAAREFFISDYVNRDHLGLVIQTFTNPQGGAVVEARRRDRPTLLIIPGSVYRIQVPAHVTWAGSPIKPDWALLRALLASREREDYSAIHQGIALFNQANTDAPDTSPDTELVLTYAAMQQILGLSGGDERQFPGKFADAWCPSREVPPSEWRRLVDGSGSRREANLRACWAFHLRVCRGKLAHGHHADQVPLLWTVPEHLLLTSFAVPRLVKQVLSGLDLYELTDKDTRDINAFESLLNLPDLFGPPCSVRDGERRSHGESAWQKVLPSCHSVEYIVEQLRQP